MEPQEPYKASCRIPKGDPHTILRGQMSRLCQRLGLGSLTSMDIAIDDENLLDSTLKFGEYRYRIQVYRPPSTSSTIESAKNEVSTLMWLRSKRLPVPFIVAYDFSKDNELGYPYVLEGAFTGVPADKIYHTLPLEQKEQVVRALADVMVMLRQVTFMVTGKLVTREDLTLPKYWASWKEGPNKWIPLTDARNVEEELPFSDMLELTHAATSHTESSRTTENKSPAGADYDYEQKMEDAMELMAEDPFFFATASESCCLFFRDLLPSKVFLLQNYSGEWSVAGITCRDAWSLKETAAASPPSWLWGGVPEQHFLSQHDCALISHQFPRAEKLALKKLYDDLMAKTIPDTEYYTKQTYGIGKWFRRMIHCHKFHLPLGRTPDAEIDKFLSGWADYAQLHGLSLSPVDDEDRSIESKSDVPARLGSSSPQHENLLRTGSATHGPFAANHLEPGPVSNTSAKRSAQLSTDSARVDREFPGPPSDSKDVRLRHLCTQLGIFLASNISTDAGGFIHFTCDERKRYMLRTDSHDAIKDEVACHLAAGTLLNVPMLISYDATADNPYQEPYILLEALSGGPASQWASTDQTAESRLPLARQLSAVARTIASKRLSSPGKLVADPLMPEFASYPRARTTGIKPFIDESGPLRSEGGLQGFVSSMLRYQASKLQGTRKITDRPARAYQILHIVLCQMAHVGLLSNTAYGECVLVNPNQSASNVSVVDACQHPEGVFHLAGVISWKGALSLPRIFASPPPTWLWRGDMPRRVYWWLAPLNGPNSTYRDDYKVVKHYVSLWREWQQRLCGTNDEEDASPSYVRFLGYFALEGQIEEESNYLLFERFLREWDNLCKLKGWCAYSKPRRAGFRPDWRSTKIIPPQQWSTESCDQWHPSARPTPAAPVSMPNRATGISSTNQCMPSERQSSTPVSSSNRSTVIGSSLPDHAPSAAPLDARAGSSAVVPAPNKGFRNATQLSDLTKSQRRIYNKLRGQVRPGTTFVAMMSALAQTRGWVQGAAQILSQQNASLDGQQQASGHGDSQSSSPQHQRSEARQENRSARPAGGARASSPLVMLNNSPQTAAPELFPHPLFGEATASRLGSDAGPPGTGMQHRQPPGAPPAFTAWAGNNLPFLTAQSSHSSGPRSLAVPSSKRPAPHHEDEDEYEENAEDARSERERKRARSDRRLERARQIIHAPTPTPAQTYPQQIYKRDQERPLREVNATAKASSNEAAAASSDDDCYITEVVKVGSSSGSEETESSSESQSDEEDANVK